MSLLLLTAAVLVGKPILKSVGKELLGLWIDSEWAKEAIVEGADDWAVRLFAKLSGGDRRAELERAFDAIAAAQPAELDALVAEVTDEAVEETASATPSDIRARLEANLRLATQRIRSAARPDVLDHAGRPTIPRSLIPRDAADLLRFLPILPPSAHQPGDTLYPQAAHLTLVRLLGVGGFGEVWETQNNNRRSEPHMAVKIFTHPDAARFIELENRNMQLIARMMENDPHPGIVPILQNHLHSRPPALAYELVQGRELSWLVQAWHDGSQGRSGPQPDQAARLLLRIAHIVAHFHRHGIIHRDLKPANILIDTATLRPRITDFGLSQAQAASEASPKAAQRHSLASVTALKGSGTLGYASPEQFDRNVPADVRDDVHALGVIGYELLTAELPRGGMSPAMMKKLRNGGVPVELVDMLAECLEQKRDDRLDSAQALVAGLIELCGPLAGEASSASSIADVVSGFSPPRSVAPPAQASPEARLSTPNLPAASPASDATKRDGLKPETTSGPASPLTAQSAPLIHIPSGRISFPSQPSAGTRHVIVLPGDVPLPLRFCPAGSFIMGSPVSEMERRDEETQHRVTLTQGFWMAETPMTQAQWRAVVSAAENKANLDPDPSHFRGSELPVEQVIWEDCVQLISYLDECATLSDGLRWALPTEAQWEYACRAGTTTPFHFGETCDGSQANILGTIPYGTMKQGTCLKETSKVCSYPANAWGLADMHGNVWEWCADWYADYADGGAFDPQGAYSGSDRVLRGGSWSNGARGCRSASRHWSTPSHHSYYYIGFRVAAVAASP